MLQANFISSKGYNFYSVCKSIQHAKRNAQPMGLKDFSAWVLSEHENIFDFAEFPTLCCLGSQAS